MYGKKCGTLISVMKLMDIELNYYEQGNGFPLILLHGNGEDMTYFTNQVDCFSQVFRVIAVDTRGHGRTPRGEAPFTIRQFAEDLKCFMDAHAIEKAHILGFSDGGNIAMCFALKYPERVEKLILNGANLFPRGVKAYAQIPITLGYYLARLFAMKSPDAHQQAELLGLMVKDPYIKPEELARIYHPTLVIAGDSDLIKESHTRLICDSLPNGQLAIIPGDHGVAAKNPTVFNETVLEFLFA